MSAHALMSLRGEKHEDEWAPVWGHLGVEPLDKDAAVTRLVGTLSSKKFAAHPLKEPTVVELLADADAIGLDQGHIAQLSTLIGRDDQHRLDVLEHVTDKAGWQRSDLTTWEDVPTTRTGKQRHPSLQRSSPTGPSVSLHQLASSLATVGLLSGPVPPDVPACNAVDTDGGTDGATTVFGQFTVEAPLQQLAFACNPANWPSCSWFFISMDPQTAPTPLPQPDALGGDAYEQVRREVVGLENMLTIETDLLCRYYGNKASVGMEFDLAPGGTGDGRIDVDHGYLLAEDLGNGSVRVTSQKTFSFVGLDDLPFTWLCSFGWIDMMRAMASCH